jgi:hypothetical protein
MGEAQLEKCAVTLWLTARIVGQKGKVYPPSMKTWTAFLGKLLLVTFGLVFSYRGLAQIAAQPSEMDRIFADDQRARRPPDPKAPPELYKSDAEREAATRSLLAAGQLQSAKEFREAAFIFQHSHEPDDYLLAHTLAMIAMAKGDQSASWIAAATLDRYLMAIGKSQIYGTQFMTPQGQPVTQEPYNRTLISDDLRKELGVPALADQGPKGNKSKSTGNKN